MIKSYSCPACNKVIPFMKRNRFNKSTPEPCPNCGVKLINNKIAVKQFNLGQLLIMFAVAIFIIDAFLRRMGSIPLIIAWICMLIGGFYFIKGLLGVELKTLE